MPQPTFDPSSKWLLEEHGAAILYLASLKGLMSFESQWRSSSVQGIGLL